MTAVRASSARVTAVLCAFLALLMPAGCSHLFSRPPPPRPLYWEGECMSSRAPVVGDVLGSVYTGAIAFVGFAGAALVAQNASEQTVPSWDPEPRTPAAMPYLLALGALGTAATVGLIGSARHGLQSARSCEAAQAELAGRQMGWPPQPAWQWPPPVQGGPPTLAPPYAPQPPPASPPAPQPAPEPAPEQ